MEEVNVKSYWMPTLEPHSSNVLMSRGADSEMSMENKLVGCRLAKGRLNASIHLDVVRAMDAQRMRWRRLLMVKRVGAAAEII